jgi:xanthine dehydrogenase small subunit
VRPRDLADALELLAEDDALAVAGATDLGVEINLRGTRPRLLIAVDRLEELRDLQWSGDELRIGAGLTLTEIERRLAGRVPVLDQFFWQFASRPIRNGATLGGNLGTGSPIGDSMPVLLALDADVVLVSNTGERRVRLADYFTGYRTSLRGRDELIKEVVLPLPLAPLTAFHKVAKRRYDDISSVAVGFALDVSDGVVGSARIGLGGVAATPVRAVETEAALTGRPWTQETVDRAAAVLAAEGTPIDDQRSSARYRSAMLGQSLRRLFAESVEAVTS